MESLGNTPAVGFVGQQQLLEGVENWCTWSYKIKIILRAADLLSIVDGTVQPPSDGKAEEYEKWMNKDAKAQSILVTRISEKVLAQIVSCQTSKEIWNKLHTVFEQRGELSVHILQQKFFSMKFEEKETVTEFLGRFESLLCKLKNVKAEVSTSMAITKITSSLPSQYQHFVSAWESVPAEKRTMEELTARLLIEEQRATTCMQDSNESAALASRSSRKCFQCGKTGHIKRNCKNKVVTSVPESSAPSPPCVRGSRWSAAGAVVQLVADALIAVAFCNEAIRVPMFATGIPLWLMGTFICAWQPAHSLGMRKAQSIQGPITMLTALLFLTPLLLDSWPAITLFAGAGVVIYARCERWCGDLAVQQARTAMDRRKLRPVTATVPLSGARLTHIDTVYIAR